jgi:hypothetical protein
MAKHARNLEGDNEQRRDAARDAREQGKRPSEVGATLGASQQRKEAPNDATHQEKMDLKHEGKHGGTKASASNERARPGSRENDPGRDDREAPFQ